jgi:hypothetical protein
MLKKIELWLGHPGMVLAWLLIIGLIGTVGAILVAPFAAIPLVRVVTLPFDPFPTVVVYSAAALAAYLVIKQMLRFLPIKASVTQWTAGISAATLVVSVGYHLPNSWNVGAGLDQRNSQDRPLAIAIPNGGTLALIDHGNPKYISSDNVCFTLLLQETVKFVEVASTLREPSPLQGLPGKRYSLKPQTRTCLKGMRDYAFSKGDKERHQEFLESAGLPIEYHSCLNEEEITLRPEQQTTIVQWLNEQGDVEGQKVGFSRPVRLFRTIVPQGDGRSPAIQEARYRSGYRYVSPLYFSSYQGNAGMGTFFSPSIATSHFVEPGSPDSSEPLFWGMFDR